MGTDVGNIRNMCQAMCNTSDFITSENVNWIYSNYNYYRDIHFEFI